MKMTLRNCYRPRVVLLLAIVCIFPLALNAQNTNALPVPKLPNINTNNVIVITNVTYGAKGDGVTTNTTAIQNAINAASAGGTTNGLSGGTVEIPAGIFLTGPLTFKSKVNLQIDGGAILRALSYTQYPGGITDPSDFISGSSLANIEISGAGAIDGQGAPWWPGYKTNSRPYLISFSGCNTVLVQNVTVSNAPAQNLVFKGKGGNILIQAVTMSEPASSAPVNPSHNTDAIDLVGTNCVVQNCNLSVGDDNIALGTSSSGTPTANVLVTNCAFGSGHGVSIGSNTEGGVSNLTVINCTFNNTDNGIRMKSDNKSSGGSGQGGITQNLSYLNLGMTNVGFPILIYSYYSEVGTPDTITPAIAAAETIGTVTANTPVWRNITISNLTVIGGGNCVIWSRTELPATNIVFDHVNISTSTSFEIYNAGGVQFVDSQISPPAASSTFLLFNAQVAVTNSSPAANLVMFDGLTTNGLGNVLSLYNAQASLKNTNVFDDGPLTIGASILAISNNLTLFPSTVLNYALGTNATTVVVTGNLKLGGTINVTGGAGFTNGTYTLLTYTGNLSGNLPVLGAEPAGFNYSFDANKPGQVNLVAALPISLAPTNILFQIVGGNQMQLSWPQNHLGWRLEIETNSLSAGLGANWFTVPNSTNVDQITIPINTANDSVFLRLVYP